MANQTNFTAEEWTQLLEAPMLAGMAVSAAEPSGLFGMLKESFATGKLLRPVVAGPEKARLIREHARAHEARDHHGVHRVGGAAAVGGKGGTGGLGGLLRPKGSAGTTGSTGTAGKGGHGSKGGSGGRAGTGASAPRLAAAATAGGVG